MEDGIVYDPSPTAIRFHNDDNFVRGIRGPVGSGKSSMCVAEFLSRAMQQRPNRRNRRKVRGLIVRNTFGELKSTTIKTCEQWWGHLGRFIYDSPIRFECERTLPDGTILEFEVYFLPLDRPDQVKKLKSLEVTFAWINEASEVPFAALELIRGRVGRYPAAVDGGPTWAGIIMDTNPPPVRSWWHDLFEVKKSPGHRQFTQPGGLIKVQHEDGTVEYLPNPLAENIAYLPGGYQYYFNQIAGAEDHYINTMVLGNYGANFDGKPVYPQFRDAEHCAPEPIQIPPAGQFVVGMDFGLNPAAIFTTMSPTGMVGVVDELCSKDITFDEFLDDMFMPRIATAYRHAAILVVGDPSGANRNALSTMTVFDKLRERGISCTPAITNDFMMRRDAVAHYLVRRGMFLLSPSCTMLHEGFLGGYRYAPLKGSAGAFKATPEKDAFSHPHDGLQYAALHYYRGLIRPRRPHTVVQTINHLAPPAPRRRPAFA